MLPTEGTRVPPSYSRFNVLINHFGFFVCVRVRARFPQSVPQVCLVLAADIGASVTTKRCATM